MNFKNRCNKLRKKIKSCGKETIYLLFRNNFRLREKNILFQSRYGDDLGGNIFYVLKEVSNNYSEFTCFLAFKNENKDKYKELLNNYRIPNVKLVKIHSIYYWYLLATSKFLINDVTFHSIFIKRKRQVYLNTWHGTPLKKMGIEESTAGYLFGNMQRNFLASDYLLCPSQYMKEIMTKAYSLSNLFCGKFLECGFPRNSVFFDQNRRNEVRKQLGMTAKSVIVYMPTWRGNTIDNKSDKYVLKLCRYLDELDEKLKDNQVFFVKLHPMVTSEIDFDKYQHIHSFPDGYETYDFLNIADCLISDYSSIIFDFACSGKNIVLFTYDVEEYLKDRGLYLDLEQMPFSKAKTIDEMLYYIEHPVEYIRSSFIQDIIQNECKESVHKICKMLFTGEGNQFSVLESNSKENVYIFVDYLPKNGITSAAFNLINTIDLNKRNYFFVYSSSRIEANKDKLREIPYNVGIMAFDGIDKTFLEAMALKLYFKYNSHLTIVKQITEKCYKHNFEKYYNNIPQGCFFQFTGYGRDPLNLFKLAKNNVILIHNDMKNEIYVKKIQHEQTLIDCYRTYKKVAGVSEASTKVAEELAKKNNFTVVHNCFDFVNTMKEGNQPIQFDRDTEYMLYDTDGINNFLNGSGDKFITIGRFSSEKEHKRLIDAFQLYWKKYRKSKLIIIGGYGPLYNKTRKYCASLPCYKNICIIKSIRNPISILKKCDLFILSSSKEGLPVVFFEADCMRIPILSTDIGGPHEFLNEYKGGMLVKESTEALYEGMLEYKKGNIRILDINPQKYNEQCIAEFESLFY